MKRVFSIALLVLSCVVIIILHATAAEKDYISQISKNDCFLCGDHSHTKHESFWGKNNIGLVHLNTFDVLPLRIIRYSDSGEIIREKFGILEKTGIDLQGESKGIFFDRNLVVNTDKWGTASLTSGSFGQTFKITPLQLVRAVAAVVNGGSLMEPYLVSEVVDAKGNTVLKQEPTVLRQVISEETSRTMCELIASVVTEGTAKNAKVSGFSIGGKTGTSNENRDAWFVGATDKLVIGVWVGNDDFSPMDSAVTGGTVPAEIFRDIILH